jgi:hypothetical protein
MVYDKIHLLLSEVCSSRDLVEKKQRNSVSLSDDHENLALLQNFMQDVKRQVLEVDDTLDKVEVLGMGSLQSSMMKMWWT